jgi:hypothetical protein
MGLLMQQMKTYYHTTSLAIGANHFDAAKGVMQFAGLHMEWPWVVSRIIATIWPISLLAIARVFFHRFDPARVRTVPNEKSRRSWLGRLNLISKPMARLFVRLGNAVLRLLGSASFARSAATDALATIAAFPLTSIAIVIFAAISLGQSNAKSLLGGFMPMAFAACAIAIADIASREKRSATIALIFAAPSLRTKFVWWKFTSALLVAITFLAVPVARAITFRPSAALPLLIGIIFTAAAATTLGIISANPKTFIVAFLSFWYVTLSDKGMTPSLDFAGWFGTATPPVLAAYAAASLGLLIIAELYHRHDLRRRW